ncbi:hypothetical protein EDD86DRAFT_190535 [Gorgonomyces haynaldii]|nr:hypothetical protein EDD86DRAFT_190535 [Gorgonomyces haynaldii]
MNNLPAREFNTIVVGGVLLAANAGYINVVSMAGITVSHVTGSVSRIGMSVFNGDFDTFALVGSVVICFMFGCFISGYLVGDTKFRLSNMYGYTLFLEAGFLFASYVFLKQELILGEWCAAFAMGLQNAMCTSYSGLVVRTTHMTGIATDIGNILGQSMRRDTKAEVWRVRVHAPLMAGFLVGGFVGQIGYNLLKTECLLIPVAFTGGVATLYLSLPWVKEAAKQIKIVEELIVPAPEQDGVVNPHIPEYSKKLDTDMHQFLADIESDQSKYE